MTAVRVPTRAELRDSTGAPRSCIPVTDIHWGTLVCSTEARLQLNRYAVLIFVRLLWAAAFFLVAIASLPVCTVLEPSRTDEVVQVKPWQREIVIFANSGSI
jgi:hypothetical protein